MKSILLRSILALMVLGLGLGLSCSDYGEGCFDPPKSKETNNKAADDDTADDDSAGDDAADDDANAGDTWDDLIAGLTWQLKPPSTAMRWYDAKAYCESLALAGGGWHLPGISDLRTLIRGCIGTGFGGACGVWDECFSYADCYLLGGDQDENNNPCRGCSLLTGPGYGGAYWPPELYGEITYYWSSTAAEDPVGNDAWGVSFRDGVVTFNMIDLSYSARCVR